jgi:hypothetical protein
MRGRQIYSCGSKLLNKRSHFADGVLTPPQVAGFRINKQKKKLEAKNTGAGYRLRGMTIEPRKG